jgi:hypothetical protein
MVGAVEPLTPLCLQLRLPFGHSTINDVLGDFQQDCMRREYLRELMGGFDELGFQDPRGDLVLIESIEFHRSFL